MALGEGPDLAVDGGDGGRLYRWDNRIVNLPGLKAQTEDFPSVTSLIGKLDKPALPPWYAKMVSHYVVDNWDEVKGKVEEEDADLDEVKKWLKKEPVRRRDQAGNRGTAVHELLDLAYGQEMGIDEAYGKVIGSAAFEGMKNERLDEVARPIAKFFKENVIEIVAAEGTVYNTRHLYAGSFDAMVRMKDGALAIVDYKTSNRVYETNALQLTAYSMCDKLAEPIPEDDPRWKAHMEDNPELKEEKKVKLAALQDLPVADYGIIAHLPGNYKATMYYTEFTKEQEQCVIALRKLWQWVERSNRKDGWFAKKEIYTSKEDL